MNSFNFDYSELFFSTPLFNELQNKDYPNTNDFNQHVYFGDDNTQFFEMEQNETFLFESSSEEVQSSLERNSNDQIKLSPQKEPVSCVRTRSFKSKEISTNESEEVYTEKYSEDVIKEIKNLAVSYKRDWKKISKRIFTLHKVHIDHFQLRMIYKRESTPHQGKPIKFSEEEDKILMNAIEEVGLDWLELSKYFADRSALSLRNRYFLILREGKMNPIKSKIAKKTKKEGTSKSFGHGINLKMKINDIILDEKPAWMESIENLLSEYRSA